VKKQELIKIGVIVSVIIFIFFWGVNFLKGKSVFNSDKTFYVVYNHIDGLAVSSPVLINGFNVGQVLDIDFMPNTSGKLIVQITVNNKCNIPKGSTARIFSSDIMGTKAIKLIFEKNKELQVSGDTLIGDSENSLQELVSQQILPIKDKAENLMTQMEDAIKIVNYIFNEETQNEILTDLKNIKQTLINLEKSSADLNDVTNNSKAQITNILNNVDNITTNLSENNQTITNTLNNISNITDSISKTNLKQAVNETAMMLTQLNEITTKINNSEGSLGLLLNDDSLYYNIDNVTKNLDILLKDLHKNPKRYVHLSAFSKDKIIYVKDDDKKQKISYSILIKESNQSLSLEPSNFKGYKVTEVVKNNIHYYLTGNEKNIKNADKLLNEIKLDFPNARIIKINNYNYEF
jgi:phospholipid/cholesterol/gamma-HCH transport system substrate-binding protein